LFLLAGGVDVGFTHSGLSHGKTAIAGVKAVTAAGQFSFFFHFPLPNFSVNN